jgi:hypothetical protein
MSLKYLLSMQDVSVKKSMQDVHTLSKTKFFYVVFTFVKKIMWYLLFGLNMKIVPAIMTCFDFNPCK